MTSTTAPTDPAPLGLTYMTMRMPKGLFEDLESTLIESDQRFIQEVCRSLGFSPADTQTAVRRVLGTGTPQAMPVLWTPKSLNPAETTAIGPEFCPWWDRIGADGLWRRCPRHRLAPNLPCVTHERAVPCAGMRLDSDPFIRALPAMIPVEHDETLYWVGKETGSPCYRDEDGSAPTDGTFRYVTDSASGTRVLTWFSREVLDRMTGVTTGEEEG